LLFFRFLSEAPCVLARSLGEVEWHALRVPKRDGYKTRGI